MTLADMVIKSLLGEGIDPAPAAVCTERLQQMGQFNNASYLKYSENIAELHSYLRNGVFHNDAKTSEFIRQCQAALQNKSAGAIQRDHRVQEAIGTPNLPVKVRTPDGQVIDAVFNGYYDWPGKGKVPSIGYKSGGPSGGWTHGPMHPGDEIASPVPSPEEWNEMERKRIEQDSQTSGQQPPVPPAA